VPLDPLRIPEQFWARADVRAALRHRDMGGLFRLVVREIGASQTQLGAAVGLEQGYVSRVVAGRKITSIDVLERIADGLDITDDARTTLGLAGRQPRNPTYAEEARHGRHGATPIDRSWRDEVAGARDLWRGDVRRRDVLRQTAFSSAGYTLPALRWFISQPPEPVTQAGSRVVGTPDVDTIREVTSAYRRLDNQYGGGHAREAVARYLDQEVAPLLRDGRFDPATGRALLAASAELTQLAGWQAYDLAEHGIAQRYLVVALDLARAAEDTGLGAEILAAMSHQATYLADSSTGVDLARVAGQAAIQAGVSALIAEAFVLEAHAHARAGDSRACAAALHAAEKALDRADRSGDPQWIAYFDEAYLSARFGHCFLALRHAAHAERFAARSLRMDNRYVRGRAFNLALLAGAYAQQSEPDRAASVGGEALALTLDLKSARAVSYIRDLQRQLAPHRSRPAVRQFIARIDATLGRRR
jgi:transcriptional regulator with XRE-family HTH domain